MKATFAAAMHRAASLTRAGDLAEATRLIQSALRGNDTPSTDRTGDSDTRARLARPPVIDLEATVVDERREAPRQPAAAPGGRVPKGRTRPLAEAVRDLAAARRLFETLPAGRRADDVVPPVASGARFLSRDHRCEAGARPYHLYVPSTHAEGVDGLILMLHGCKQDPVDFAVGTRGNETAEAGRMIAVYPGQVSAANPSACWNWFDPRDQRRGAGEPAILADLARSLAAEFGVPPSRVFVAGLSAGGAMAAILAQTYPDVFAGAAIHSGLAAGSAVDVASAFAAMKGSRRMPTVAPPPASPATPRLIVFHGSADGTVHPSNGEAIVDAWRPPGTEERRLDGRSADGRRFRRVVHRSGEGDAVLEHWTVEGLGHAWSGGNRLGSYTDPTGPDASAEMMRFFADPQRPGPLE